MANVFLSAFLDGFTGGSLFFKLEQPGAATAVFAEDALEPAQQTITATDMAPGRSIGVTERIVSPIRVDSGDDVATYATLDRKISILTDQLRPEIGEQGVEAVTKTIRQFQEKKAYGAAV